MDSPVFTYSPGWRVAPDGADPSEPADPWSEPSGALSFTYTGGELALRLAPGDYWGYLYVTVDGETANLLPDMRGNVDSRSRPAGYRTFYAPEAQQDDGPSAQWQRIHRAADASRAHTVAVEVWRSWGQTPLRGIAVDALPPPPLPRWPGILLLALSFAAGYPLTQNAAMRIVSAAALVPLRAQSAPGFCPNCRRTAHPARRGSRSRCRPGHRAGLMAVGRAGLALLAYLSVSRPALWSAAVVLALPFYFSFDIPLPGGRAAGLIDVLLLAGIAVAAANALLFAPAESTYPKGGARNSRRLAWLLAALIAWALVAVFAAEHFTVALREWRTVFLSAGLFAMLLAVTFRASASPRDDLWLIMASWVTGGAVAAAIGLAQYLAGAMLISAEGVYRIRAFYGSPNNLALYLERTFPAALAWAAFFPAGRARLLSALAAGLQGAALLPHLQQRRAVPGRPRRPRHPLGGRAVHPAQPGQVAAASAVAGRRRRSSWRRCSPSCPPNAFSDCSTSRRGPAICASNSGAAPGKWPSTTPGSASGRTTSSTPTAVLYLLPQAWQEPNLNHPHNWPLDWWTRLGIPGLALALAWFAAVWPGCGVASRYVARPPAKEPARSTSASWLHPSPR